MTPRPSEPRDPFFWNAAITFLFFLLALVRLTTPSAPFFDEVHYLPAARALLELTHRVNVEHPLLGKELIALGMMIFGDGPMGWRIMPLLAGVIGLFAFQRALWLASFSRFTAIAGGILLITAFPLFIQARIAMLDIFMVSFLMVALWMCAAAMAKPAHARWHLMAAGTALGCAMACKWNAVPVAMMPGLAFLVTRLEASGGKFLLAQDTGPIRGITLVEAGVWLGLAPVIVYGLTFVPAFFYQEAPLGPGGLIAYHQSMLDLQTQILAPHPYQSTWPQWVSNSRAIWYLYEQADGAQRGVLLVGNPFTMLAGLPAMAWCAWQGVFRKRWDCLAVAALYAASLGLWLVADKSVQFFYHYFLPSCFLMAALALALGEMWNRANRWLPLAVLGISLALFGWFYPILSAAALGDPQGFLNYAWAEGWR